ncbi:WYL domain-containing protein [Streptomyces sp. NBC_00704]|uniref:helix-turn-helix transcriptional regulator n=1 Tax=Streptomyces sp. NBC_00704 TaxID=2975809 RepID=UPI002E2EBD97|nr:WYL domain-containing protein [Streptomyces sp. NBC_00704]
MSRPTGRVLTLLELLQSGGVRTMGELADRLGVDGRTVRRYVDQLVDLDVPVEAVRGRYGGYRIGAGYRLPPLMLSDDEALAVLLGLLAGRRAGLTATGDTASETAAAKIRRVLPPRLSRRLDAVLESLAFTAAPEAFASPDAEILLTIADAVRHSRPLRIGYTDRAGRRSERTLHPYGIVAHAGRWYVTGADPGIGEDRTFRLDRVAAARTLPGSFEAPDGPGAAQRVVSGFATAEYRHEVALRIHATADAIRARLPATVASLTPEETRPPADVHAEDVHAEDVCPADVTPADARPATGGPSGTATGNPGGPATGGPGDPATGTPGEPAAGSRGEPTTGSQGDPTTQDPGDPTTLDAGDPTTLDAGDPATPDPGDPGAERWWRVELRVERLDWLPSVLASLDRPFAVERPDELRGLVVAFADRLASRARRA